MKIFFDTEFIEDGKTIDLLSIGMVAEDGRKLYLENIQADWSRADPWVWDNVIPQLELHKTLQNPTRDRDGQFVSRPACAVSRMTIAQRILGFVGEQPEFWAYYADYDWVVLCQLYGRMIDLPNGWPMFCMDFKQWLVTEGLGAELKKLPESDAHNALTDALWLKSEFARLGGR